MAHHLDHPRPGQRAAGTLRQQMGVQFRLTFMQSAVCLDLMSGTRQATSQDLRDATASEPVDQAGR